MKKLPDCKIKNNKWSLRWTNWQDFFQKEEKIRYKKQNKVAILCLFYSSLDNIKLLFDYLSKEKHAADFDLILINNSPYADVDFAKELKNDNIIIISPLKNLWTDWWYAFGIEYCIKNNYEYLFILEDDVVFLDQWVFSDIYDKMDQKSVWFISSMVNNTHFPHSWYVQVACYPVSFLEKTWLMDPRFFTRWWEYKWIFLMEDLIKKYWYKKKIVDKRHFHPYLKKGNRNAWWIYFSWRNVFWNIRRVDFLWLEIIFFMYIWTGFSRLFLERSSIYLKSLFYAIKDFLITSRNIETSLDRMSMLSKHKLPIVNSTKDLSIGTDEVSDYTKGLFTFDWLWVRWFTSHDSKQIRWTRKISAFFKKWIIIPNINCPLYPIAILAKKIIAVNEFDVIKNTADISIITPKFNLTFLRVFVAFWIALIVYILILIPINLKVFLLWIKSWLNKKY